MTVSLYLKAPQLPELRIKDDHTAMTLIDFFSSSLNLDPEKRGDSLITLLQSFGINGRGGNLDIYILIHG